MTDPRRDDFPNHFVGDLVETEHGWVIVPPTCCPAGHDYGDPGWNVATFFIHDREVCWRSRIALVCNAFRITFARDFPYAATDFGVGWFRVVGAVFGVAADRSASVQVWSGTSSCPHVSLRGSRLEDDFDGAEVNFVEHAEALWCLV